MSPSRSPELLQSEFDPCEPQFATGKMTERRFERWALTTGGRVEWVEGKVIAMSPASRKQVQLSGWIHSLLLIVAQQSQLGEVLGPEYMVRLRKGEKSRRVPDILFVSKERLGLLQQTYLDGPPDIAIEIVSPDSVARDWREKYLAYEHEGVKEYWIIDPLSESLEAYTLKRKKFRPIPPAADGTVVSSVIPKFLLRPAWLWQDPLPPVLGIVRELGLIP